MNDAAPSLTAPATNPLVKALEDRLAEARAGKIIAMSVVWLYGPEVGSYQNLGALPLAMAGLCQAASGAWADQAFKKQSPIIRAIPG